MHSADVSMGMNHLRRGGHVLEFDVFVFLASFREPRPCPTGTGDDTYFLDE